MFFVGNYFDGGLFVIFKVFFCNFWLDGLSIVVFGEGGDVSDDGVFVGRVEDVCWVFGVEVELVEGEGGFCWGGDEVWCWGVVVGVVNDVGGLEIVDGVVGFGGVDVFVVVVVLVLVVDENVEYGCVGGD